MKCAKNINVPESVLLTMHFDAVIGIFTAHAVSHEGLANNHEPC